MPGSSVPALDHVFLVILENHGFDEVVGVPEAPYLASLVAAGGLATNYSSVAHPSLPNYLALLAGSSFGVDSDCTDCFQSGANLATDRISPSGRTWRGYMESMPSAAFVGDAYPYMQKHDPFVYFDAIRNDPDSFANVVPYSQLTVDLRSSETTPNFAWITPNMLHDMHDGTVAAADAWLAAEIPAILGSPAFRERRSLLVVTWDEDDNAPGNRVATILVGADVAPGSRSATAYNHYSLLRTIEDAWSLEPLTANDTAATAMADLFTTSRP